SCATDGRRAARRASPSAAGARRAPAARCGRSGARTLPQSGWSPCTGRRAARRRVRARRGVSSAVAELAQQALVAGPVALHLHPDAEIDLAAEEALHVLARRRGDALEQFAPGADHDRLLALALDPDRGLDAPQALAPALRRLVLEAFQRHVAAIGQLLAQQQEQLLAQNFRGEKALVAVGELLGGIGRGPLGQ